MKTDQELEKMCEEIWKVKNTWGLSAMQFRNLAMNTTYENEHTDNHEGDAVYTSPSGCVLTRYMAHRFFVEWGSFYHGFVTAWRMAEKTKCSHCGELTPLHPCGDGSELLCDKCLSTCMDM